MNERAERVIWRTIGLQFFAEGEGEAGAEGVEGQEVADPADSTDELVLEVEDEEGIEAEDGGEPETNEEPEPSGDTEAQKKPEQTPEQRRREAAARRAREKEAERRAEQAKVDAAYARAFKGQKNPYTGKPILTEKEFLEYTAAYEKEARDKQLKKAGLTEDVIQGIVRDDPVVKQAQQVIEEAKRAKEEANAAKARAAYDADVKRIATLDPEVKDLESLRVKCGEKWADVLNLVGKGVALYDAYRLQNLDTLAKRNAAAAAQAAKNKAAGKAYMKKTGGGGRKTVSVPAETVRQYRKLFPGMSDAEIAKSYAKHHIKK